VTSIKAIAVVAGVRRLRCIAILMVFDVTISASRCAVSRSPATSRCPHALRSPVRTLMTPGLFFKCPWPIDTVNRSIRPRVSTTRAFRSAYAGQRTSSSPFFSVADRRPVKFLQSLAVPPPCPASSTAATTRANALLGRYDFTQLVSTDPEKLNSPNSRHVSLTPFARRRLLPSASRSIRSRKRIALPSQHALCLRTHARRARQYARSSAPKRRTKPKGTPRKNRR